MPEPVNTHAPDARPSGAIRLRDRIGPHPWLQLAVLLGLTAVVYILWRSMTANMAQSGIVAGFAFLRQPANFEIGESLIAYSAQSSFGRAILVGLLNTLLVSVAGCVLATFLGLALGIARITGNALVRGAVRSYVEIIRNTPLLLQLFFWSAIVQALPVVRKALEPVPGFILSNRGFYFPALSLSHPSVAVGLAIVFAVFWLWLRPRLASRPQFRRKLGIALIVSALIAITLALVAGGASLSLPQRAGFNVKGGLSQTPEFVALLAGLSINAAAGISEIVRSGMEAVPQGQWEAANALGMKRGQIIRLVILPQALRIIVPLMTSSYLSLTKNPSLAVAIGYPDLVSILNTTANQTGQALEAIVIMLGIYLAISLGVSAIMNLIDARHALKER